MPTETEDKRRVQAWVSVELFRQVLIYAHEKQLTSGEAIAWLLHRGLAVESSSPTVAVPREREGS